MSIIKPNGHKEIYVPSGSVILKKYEDWSKCGKGEYQIYSLCKDIRFNDVYATFTHIFFPSTKQEHKYVEVGDWFIEVVSKNFERTPMEEDRQLSIFNFLED